MRKIILSINTTLDGIVSDELSWMRPDTDQTWRNWFDMLAEVDLLLLGGGMWTDYRNFWDRVLTEPGFHENEIQYARYARNTPHLIFSSSIQSTGWEHATIQTGDLKQCIQQLKQQPGKNIQIVGGGKFASAVMNTGLVDEYRLLVNPVILGSGQSLYDHLKLRLELDCTQTALMDNGVVILTYRQRSAIN